MKQNELITDLTKSLVCGLSCKFSTTIKIAEEFLEEDEIRMIRYLLSNTNIKPKINRADIETKFEANIGTPQGDSISPVLFNIYLEKTLREIT